jgi:hypothetical protein
MNHSMRLQGGAMIDWHAFAMLSAQTMKALCWQDPHSYWDGSL